MKDYATIFKAFVMPYTAVCSVSGIVFMTGTGQEVPMILYGLFFGALGEMGIHWSLSKLEEKIRR